MRCRTRYIPVEADTALIPALPADRRVNPLLRNENPCESASTHAGFSIIEALVVSGLLAIAISVFVAILFAANVNTSVQRTSVASSVAVRKMEELRATSFASLPGSGPFSDAQLLQLPNATASISVADYLATSSIMQIVVTVSWQEGAGTRSYILDSLFTNGGTNPP